MRYRFCLVVLLTTCWAALAEPLPMPDAEGDFGRTGHRWWKVVAPHGLRGRMTAEYLKAWIADRNGSQTARPAMNVPQWPVVAVFAKDTVLSGTPYPQTGWVNLQDSERQAWLMVGSPNQPYCLVRFNKEFVVPTEAP